MKKQKTIQTKNKKSTTPQKIQSKDKSPIKSLENNTKDDPLSSNFKNNIKSTGIKQTPSKSAILTGNQYLNTGTKNILSKYCGSKFLDINLDDQKKPKQQQQLFSKKDDSNQDPFFNSESSQDIRENDNYQHLFKFQKYSAINEEKENLESSNKKSSGKINVSKPNSKSDIVFGTALKDKSNKNNNYDTSNSKQSDGKNYNFLLHMEKKFNEKNQTNHRFIFKEDQNENNQIMDNSNLLTPDYQPLDKKEKRKKAITKNKKKQNNKSDIAEADCDDDSDYDLSQDIDKNQILKIEKSLEDTNPKRQTRSSNKYQMEEDEETDEEEEKDKVQEFNKKWQRGQKNPKRPTTTSEEEASAAEHEDDENIPKILKKYKIFVDICSANGEESNKPFIKVLRDMGATIRKKLSKNCTVMIWQDGDLKNYNNAKEWKIPTVTSLWVDECYDNLKEIDMNKHKVKDLSDIQKKQLDDNKKNRKKGFKTDFKSEQQAKHIIKPNNISNNTNIFSIQKQNTSNVYINKNTEFDNLYTETGLLNSLANRVFQECVYQDIQKSQLDAKYGKMEMELENLDSDNSNSFMENNQKKGFQITVPAPPVGNKQVKLENFYKITQNTIKSNNNIDQSNTNINNKENSLMFPKPESKATKKSNNIQSNNLHSFFKPQIKKSNQQCDANNNKNLMDEEDENLSRKSDISTSSINQNRPTQFIISIHNLSTENTKRINTFFEQQKHNYLVVNNMDKLFNIGDMLLIQESKLIPNLVYSQFITENKPIVNAQTWITKCEEQGSFADYQDINLNIKFQKNNFLSGNKYFIYIEGEKNNKIENKKYKPPSIKDCKDKKIIQDIIENKLGGTVVSNEDNFKTADIILMVKYPNGIPKQILSHIKCIKIQWVYEIIIQNKLIDDKSFNLR